MSINLFGAGFQIQCQSYEQCLRDNRYSEVYGARWDTSKRAEGAGGGDR